MTAPTIWAILAISFGAVAFDVRAAIAAEKKTAPQWEDITLDAKDGLKLKCRYYFGKADKKTVPIIMLHAWGETGAAMYPLAEALSDPSSHGHAVVVPDLRGHGASTTILLPGGGSKQVSADSMRKIDFDAIVRYDLQAVKRLLREKHNAGKVNIEMLTLVATQESAIFATEWAALDWSIRPLPTHKLGQYVKAIVYLSPTASFKGMNLQRSLNHAQVRSLLSMLILYGENDAPARNDARRAHNLIKRFHVEDFKSEEERRDLQDLFIHGLSTSLQGSKLITAPGMNVIPGVANFIDLRLVQKSDRLVWEPRENPFSAD
jgi:pimeloyl-ACP methyl ester carboxylesterase